jgi:2-polyprenyl-3-methyl-5-hydroxy-6-metoxy-1,4-benzoquinol methylase
MRPEFENRYHKVEAEHWWFVGRRDLLSSLLRDADPDPLSRILDVGCAGGATLRRLRADGYTQVVGIDLSPEAIARCRDSGLQDTYEMDAQKPAFPDGSFDVILASDILEHVPDERAALQAWFRLLRPRGTLIALVPAFMALWSPHDEANHHHRRYRLAELRRCLEASGFETRRASYWNFLLFVPAALVRIIQRMMPGATADHVDLRVPPSFANALLASLLRGENRLLRAGLSWPFGLSALVVARRPGSLAEEGLRT